MLAKVKYTCIEQHKTQLNQAPSRQCVLYMKRSKCLEAKFHNHGIREIKAVKLHVQVMKSIYKNAAIFNEKLI